MTLQFVWCTRHRICAYNCQKLKLKLAHDAYVFSREPYTNVNSFTRKPKTFKDICRAHRLRMQDAQTRTTTKEYFSYFTSSTTNDEEETRKKHTTDKYIHGVCARGCLMRPLLLLLLIKKRNSRSRSQLIFTVCARLAHTHTTNTHTKFIWHFSDVCSILFSPSSFQFQFFGSCEYCFARTNRNIKYIKIQSFAHYTSA